MPDAAAKKVLTKYLGQDWVSDPYMNKDVLCGLERVSIKLSDVNRVIYNPGLKKLFLFWGKAPIVFFYGCDWARKSFDVKNEVEAGEITSALISLGSPIRGLTP